MGSFYSEKDGDDTLNWIAEQTWSDGNVGMTALMEVMYSGQPQQRNRHLERQPCHSRQSFIDIEKRQDCHVSAGMGFYDVSKEQISMPYHGMTGRRFIRNEGYSC